MDTTPPTLDDVKILVAEILGIPDRLGSMDASTRLLGELPELDSLAVAELIAAMETRFGLSIDAADLTADVFDTLGTLAAFVEVNSVHAQSAR
jgi:acyl carrier protein